VGLALLAMGKGLHKRSGACGRLAGRFAHHNRQLRMGGRDTGGECAGDSVSGIHNCICQRGCDSCDSPRDEDSANRIWRHRVTQRYKGLMIRFIGGKQGGGKSRVAVGRLVEELRASNRFIVTNLALEFVPWVDGGKKARKGLINSLQEKYGDDFDAMQRIVLIDDSDVHRFFRCRPRVNPGTGVREIHWIPECSDGRFRMDENCAGVCYIIDEAHEFFPAHEWEKVRVGCLSWGTQARRAGDEVYFLSQIIGNVAKPLRGLAQECLWVVNHRHLSLGWFRQFDKISIKSYATAPPAASDAPLYDTTLRDDREWIYGVYNTSKGVGVRGRQADIGQRARGIHWTWSVAFVAAFILAVIFVFNGIKMGFRKALGGAPPPPKNEAAAAPAPPPPPAPVTPDVHLVTAKESAHSPEPEKPKLEIVGIAKGARTIVRFSDGSMFEPRHIADVPGGVEVDDKVYKWRDASVTNLVTIR